MSISAPRPTRIALFVTMATSFLLSDVDDSGRGLGRTRLAVHNEIRARKNLTPGTRPAFPIVHGRRFFATRQAFRGFITVGRHIGLQGRREALISLCALRTPAPEKLIIIAI
jgi:hypothetical protein